MACIGISSSTFRACSGHEQSTRFARAAPLVLPTAEPRHALPFSPHHAKPPLATSPASQELAATATDSPCSVQRRPSLSRSPPGPWNSASSSTSVSTSARRRHDALATEWRSPATLSAATVGTDPDRLFKKPRAHPRTQAVSSHLPRTPLGQQSTREGRLPRLRPVRPPLPPGSVLHNQSLPGPPNTTNRLHSILRSRPDP